MKLSPVQIINIYAYNIHKTESKMLADGSFYIIQPKRNQSMFEREEGIADIRLEEWERLCTKMAFEKRE